MPEQAQSGIPLGCGIVVEDEPSELPRRFEPCAWSLDSL